MRRDQILAQLRSNPQVTIAELAQLPNLSDSGVEYNLRKLRQAGRIRREGSIFPEYFRHSHRVSNIRLSRFSSLTSV
ncbi:MAG: winged helix-turn-helix domain-containing protein [Dolichospermum sp.]